MTGPFPRPRASWIEPAMACLVGIGLAYSLYHLFTFAYLPQPFFYEPSDTWMDWFNTAYFARDPGTYDAWRTIYPPLSFVILRIFTLDRCYPLQNGGDFSPGMPPRSCDWLGVASIHGFYLLAVVLCAWTFFKLDRKSAPWRTFAIAAGLPLVAGLERGNLVLVAFVCLILAFGPIIRSARVRWLAVALAINLKVYLIGALVPLLLRRRWRWVEGAAIATVLVFLVSFAILGRGTPWEIYDNILAFNEAQKGAADFLNIWYTTTYTPHLGLLKSEEFGAALLLGSRNVDLLLIVIPALVHTTQLAILLAAFAIWLRPESVPTYRVINLGLMLALITSEAGGYTQVYFMYFVFMERWQGFGRQWAIFICYVLCVPLDFPVDTAPLAVVRDTFFWSTTQLVTYSVMLGPFVRPLLVLTVPFALAMVTIRQVYRDVHRDGWEPRWQLRDPAPGAKAKAVAVSG